MNIIKQLVLLLVSGALILALSAQQNPKVTTVTPLSRPFFALRTCIPFTLLVKPESYENVTAESNGSFIFVAEQAVVDSLLVDNDEGVLVLSTNNSFFTNRAINATLIVGANSSLAWIQNFGSGDIVLAPGLSSEDFYCSAKSSGNIYAFGVTSQTVKAWATGTSIILVNGTFNHADVKASGLSKVYLQGLNPANGTVEADVDGISNVWVLGGPGTNINGTAQNLAKVHYVGGSCTVESVGLLGLLSKVSLIGDPCVPGLSTQFPSFTPRFDCGLAVWGKTQCAATGHFATYTPLIPTPRIFTKQPVESFDVTSPTEHTLPSPDGISFGIAVASVECNDDQPSPLV